MSRRPTVSRPTASSRARGRWSREEDPLAVFVRGATVGAFVGAVIAGSTLWHRIRRRVADGSAGSRRLDPAPPRPDPAGPPRAGGGPNRP